MAIEIFSFFKPIGSSIYALLEDSFFKGGYRVCANTTDRDALLASPTLLKEGMLVYTITGNTTYRLNSDLASWTSVSVSVNFATVSAAIAAATGAISFNSQKITSLANGTASTDGAAFGQIPTGSAATPNSIAAGAIGNVPGSSGNWSKSDHVHGLTESVLRAVVATFTAAVDFAAQRLTNVANGTGDTDVATYGQLLARNAKSPARAAATSNVASLSGTTTIDGVSLIAGDRVLLTAQSTGSQNGLWVIAAGSWTRSNDADTTAKVYTGITVRVTEGTVGALTTWGMNTTGAITVGTTTQTWARSGSLATSSLDGFQSASNFVLQTKTNVGFPGTARTITASSNSAGTDAGKIIYWNGSSIGNYTVRAEATDGWVADETITLITKNTAALTIVAGAGVTLKVQAGKSLVGLSDASSNRYVITLVYEGSDVWGVYGDLV